MTYNQKHIKIKYYKEFWERRKKERNDSIVYQIIKDLKYSYETKFTSSTLSLNADNKLVNDTLFQLLNIEYRNDNLSNKLALEDFKSLVKSGFHQSAFNLLHERTEYENINWEKGELTKELKKADTYSNAWFEDNSK